MWNVADGSFASESETKAFGSPADTKIKQRSQTLIPCSISQLVVSQQIDDRFVIGRAELSQITIVGLIKSVKESPSRLDYELDDHSGYTIQVKLFVDVEDSSVSQLHEGQYVRVFGNLRSFASVRSVVAFKILPIMDINEITMHLAEVVYSHLFLSRPPKTAAPKMADFPSNFQTSNASNSFLEGGLTPVQRQVMEAIRANKDEQGIHMSALQRQLRNLGASVLNETVDKLSEEGYIYSTIDEHHFKTTDC
uniref:Replication protein A 32 kDa subunit n=1 Tax=Dicyema japonicum TaxID=399803 RepID=B9ZYX4_DICJA|nr:replication protein A 32 kDa subunit [Dicyema japonicum]